jgi:hypothetical protein
MPTTTENTGPQPKTPAPTGGRHRKQRERPNWNWYIMTFLAQTFGGGR